MKGLLGRLAWCDWKTCLVCLEDLLGSFSSKSVNQALGVPRGRPSEEPGGCPSERHLYIYVYIYIYIVLLLQKVRRFQEGQPQVVPMESTRHMPRTQPRQQLTPHGAPEFQVDRGLVQAGHIVARTLFLFLFRWQPVDFGSHSDFCNCLMTKNMSAACM